MHNIPAIIQAYNAETDASAAFHLWKETVGQQWPLDSSRFQKVLSAPGTRHFVARGQGAELIGFLGTQQTRSWNTNTGHVLAVLVAPAYQRRGVGSALCEAAFQYMREAGVALVQLGGLSPRFWCGVPDNLRHTLDFFQKQGWSNFDQAYDLTQDLGQYTSPVALYQRMNEQQVALAAGTQADMAEVLAFEEREYPNWLIHYRQNSRLGDYQDVFIARDKDGEIVGVLNTSTVHSHPERPDFAWPGLLGANAGTLGAVGVAASAQSRGIGLALCAKASEVLKERGVGTCIIDWVAEGTTHFYGKIGYVKWRSYHTSFRGLA